MSRLAILILPVLAACAPMDAIEGKPSAAQQHQERMALVTMPAPVQPVVAVPEPLTVAVEPVAVTPEPVPPCVPVFRVVVCDE